ELGADVKHGADSRHIVGANCIGQPLDGHAVYIRFELCPALEAIASGNHELRVMKREFRGVGSAVVRVHLRDSAGLAGGQAAQQFFGLPLQLLEIRMRPHPAGGYVLVQWSSFPRARCPHARAEKSSSKRTGRTAIQGDAVVSADTEAP